MDPSMRLFQYNDKSLLASIPTMYGFPKVSLHATHLASINEANLKLSYTMYIKLYQTTPSHKGTCISNFNTRLSE